LEATVGKSTQIQAHTDKYTLIAAIDPVTGEIKAVELGDDTVAGIHILQWVWDPSGLSWVKMQQPTIEAGDLYVAVDDLEQYVLDKLDQYKIDDFDESNDPIFYIGFQDKGGNYYIKRVNTSTGAVDYTKGSSGYAAAWTNRAAESYSDFASTF